MRRDSSACLRSVMSSNTAEAAEELSGRAMERRGVHLEQALLPVRPG